MLVDCQVSWLKDLKAKNPLVQGVVGYKADNQRVVIDLRWLEPSEIDQLVKISQLKKGHGYKQLASMVESVRMIKANPSGQPVPNLRSFVTAMTEYIKPTKNKWLFLMEDDKALPYYVDNIDYVPPRRTKDDGMIPGYSFIELRAASVLGGSRKFTWYSEQMDRTPQKLLAMHGLHLENEQLVQRYTAELALWNDYGSTIGRQFLATGTGHAVSHHWYNRGLSSIAMEREGIKTRVVVDEDDGKAGKNRDDDDDDYMPSNRTEPRRPTGTADTSFWELGYKAKAEKRRHWSDDEEADPTADVELIALPQHPWISVFDLKMHQYLLIHVNNLEPYQYDKTLGDKLILPKLHRTLLDALMTGSSEILEDIIIGKTGGTIIMATGEPGTGKTLTAEVFAEMMGIPLYAVQCSQLGLDPKSLEKQLGIVLARATRWHALLLIDEADVYIRARGEDIEQNAMVGVWLRVLEYYRGIMFMTSNRATIIDDAVMSRATAWIRYQRPDQDDLERIWTVLTDQYQMDLSVDFIQELAAAWPGITGRNVKNILKLARNLAKSPSAPTGLDLFGAAINFLDVQTKNLKEGE